MAARSLLALKPTWSGPRSPPAARGRGKALARPMGLVAVRLPERLPIGFVLSSPRLFVHEGARQRLERSLMAAYSGPVSVAITDNRHSMVSHSRERGALRARIHHMFLDAPASVMDALVRYVTLSDREASVQIGDYIEANGARLGRRSRRIPLLTRGKHHDLLTIFEDVNNRYFGGAVNVLVSWGTRTKKPRPKRSSIKLGSYNANERLIRLHPALDRKWVPRYFVAFVLFHEMLHHMMPERRTASGRRELHPAEFRERERTFRFFERAHRWEHSHLARLLRS